MNTPDHNLGVIAAVDRITQHLKTRLTDLDEPTSRNIGALGLANDIMDLMNTMLKELVPCKHCHANPCQCEAIDAQRDYGRAESWFGNDY